MSPTQVIEGTVLSITVMVVEHELLAPSGSVTVTVTFVTPNSYGPAGETVYVNTSPSASVDPPSKSEPIAPPWQLPLAGTVTAWQTATGGTLQYEFGSVTV